MTTDEKALTTTKSDAPIEWGSREEINALAQRLQVMMPGDLTSTEALALAQYSAALDANPFRGEVYAYESKGKLILVDGYKLLVRWARRQCNFYDRYTRMRAKSLPKGAIGFRCSILREDAKGMLTTLISAGAPWEEAYDLVSQSAVGIVTHKDMNGQKGPIPPPKGWTWEQVARKRALKNALNLAYGAPSPREISKETWMVGDVQTVESDWPDNPNLTPVERELAAAYTATERQLRGIGRQMEEKERDQAMLAETKRGGFGLFKTGTEANDAYTDLFDEDMPQADPDQGVSEGPVRDMAEKLLLEVGDELEKLVDEIESHEGVVSKESADDDFVCEKCGNKLEDYEPPDRIFTTFTVSQLVDIGQNLNEPMTLCGPCLKKRRETAGGTA